MGGRRAGGRVLAALLSLTTASVLLLAPAAGAKPAKHVIEVEARDNEFDAPSVTVRKGTWIKFANVGRNDHNVIPTSDAGEFLHIRTKSFEPDESMGIQMTKPGKYRYYCSIHGTRAAGMRGVIIVKG